MQGKLKYGAALIIVVLAAVALTGLSGRSGNQSDTRRMQSYLRVDGLVARTICDYQNQGEKAANDGYINRGYQVTDDMIRVVIESNDDGAMSSTQVAQSIQNSIQYWGGRIEASYGRLHRVLVPVAAVEDIARNPCVSIIRTPIKPYEAGITSEGVARSGADLFQSAPSFGGDTQVKIAVLDSGFKGYSGLLGSELPSSVATKNFRGDGDFESSAHGSACAEIVHDMMPSAEIYLVAVNDDVGFHQAVDWLIGEKVDVISSSLVWLCDAGAGDGTGPICEEVKKADEEGIIWVQAMGNFAHLYWKGQFYESSHHTGWNSMGGKNSDYLAFKANGPVEIYLSWDDWGTWDGQKYSGSDQNYGLFIYECRQIIGDHYFYEFSTATCGTFDTPQLGREPWNVPVEKTGRVLFHSNYSTGIYGVTIRRNNSNRNVNFRLYILNAEWIEFPRASGSYGIPADSAKAVSVVGANVYDELYPHNSHGPTLSMNGTDYWKPDITGYSAISTLSMGTFEGTSAAAAHVAGALGLLKSKLPYKPDDLRQVLYKRAIPLGPVGSTGHSYSFGYGRLNLLKK